MTREEAIEVLKDIVSKPMLYSNFIMGACRVALASLETDEAYQLEYEPTTKNDLGVELIDRVKLLKAMDTWDKFGYTARYGLERLDKDDKGFVPYVKYEDMVNCVKDMTSVTLQEPKTGHWTEEFNDLEGEVRFTCSSCGKYQLFGTDFCYNCGSDNREVEE